MILEKLSEISKIVEYWIDSKGKSTSIPSAILSGK